MALAARPLAHRAADRDPGAGKRQRQPGTGLSVELAPVVEHRREARQPAQQLGGAGIDVGRRLRLVDEVHELRAQVAEREVIQRVRYAEKGGRVAQHGRDQDCLVGEVLLAVGAGEPAAAVVQADDLPLLVEDRRARRPRLGVGRVLQQVAEDGADLVVGEADLLHPAVRVLDDRHEVVGGWLGALVEVDEPEQVARALLHAHDRVVKLLARTDVRRVEHVAPHRFGLAGPVDLVVELCPRCVDDLRVGEDVVVGEQQVVGDQKARAGPRWRHDAADRRRELEPPAEPRDPQQVVEPDDLLEGERLERVVRAPFVGREPCRGHNHGAQSFIPDDDDAVADLARRQHVRSTRSGSSTSAAVWRR